MQTGKFWLLALCCAASVAQAAPLLKLSALPDEGASEQQRRYAPLVRYLSAELKQKVQFVTLPDYSSVAEALGVALGVPALPVHHLEGHLLSPLLSATPPDFPFVALLVSGGHTQLMRVAGVGDYTLLGETVDDAAGEAFDKTAKLIGLPYPGGPALAGLKIVHVLICDQKGAVC